MSDHDSFIQEVSEEVRRERLFGYIRRYGWIAVLIVVLLVGGAAWNEYRKAQARAAAEGRGDAILSALEAEAPEARRAALEGIDDPGPAAPVVALLAAAEALEADDPARAADALRAIAADQDHPPVYRDLATLKLAILLTDRAEPGERIALLQPLTAPGAPFRVLAEEQIALAEIEAGETQAALDRLRAIARDTAATGGLRQRVNQLIVALGGEAEQA